MADIAEVITREFIRACPVGWSMGGDLELTRVPDVDGQPRWHLYNPDQGTDEYGGAEEAADFLRVDFGYQDNEGIHDLVDRLLTGRLGGGT